MTKFAAATLALSLAIVLLALLVQSVPAASIIAPGDTSELVF